ncbi:MAG: hypothetical protein PHF67_03010 [Candidatus Nanoarchaeia archaeon]|nr:hypothetical protein [Candidatus Nanoarchaeia archaeon]
MVFRKSLLAIIAGISCLVTGSIGGEELTKPDPQEVNSEAIRYLESIGVPREILDSDIFGRATKTPKGYSWGDSSAEYARYVVGGDTIFIDKNKLILKTNNPKIGTAIETHLLDLNGDGVVDEVQIRKPVQDEPDRFQVTRIVNVEGPESVVYPSYVETKGVASKSYYEARRVAETKPDKVTIAHFQRIYDLISKRD